jgi:two-component system chemotaxis sensor kinase CheA
VPVFSGATIMGDGRVALILDVGGLAQRAGMVLGSKDRSMGDGPAVGAAEADKQAVLTFTPGGGGRMAVPLDVVSRLEEFPRSAVERVGRRSVVQYRGELLPLVPVGRVLGGRRGRRKSRRKPAGDTVPVVVCTGAGRQVGLVVGRILDVVEESLATRTAATRPGVAFTAVVQDRVTEVLDVDAVVRLADAPAGRA